MLLAMLPAKLDEEKALPARLEAWLNLSQRENANALVMVRTSAIAVYDRQLQNALVILKVWTTYRPEGAT